MAMAGIVSGTVTEEDEISLLEDLTASGVAVQVILLASVPAVVVADSLHHHHHLLLLGFAGIVALEVMMIVLMGDGMEIGTTTVWKAGTGAVIVISRHLLIVLEAIDIWTGSLKMDTAGKEAVIVGTGMQVEDQTVTTEVLVVVIVGTDLVRMIALEGEEGVHLMIATEAFSRVDIIIY